MQTLSIKAKITIITLVFLAGASGVNAQAGLLDSLFSGKLNNPASTNTTVAGVRLQTISATYTLPDATTKRLSILIWHPVTSEGSLDIQGAPYPLIIFSHGGITGAADHCTSITENLAKQGYIVAAATHEDAISYRGQKSSSPLSAGFWDRPLDVKGIITILLELNNDPASIFYGTIAEEAIGIFGHSLGGWTGEILCGAVPPGREDYTDERVKAGMFLAPGNMLFNKNNIANVQVPSITIFGGKDTIVRTTSNRFVYDQAAAPKYFGVITNFGHLDFANYGKNKPETKVLVQYALAFFNRYLKDDYSAEETLKTSSPIFSAYEYALARQTDSDNPQGATAPVVIRAEEDSDEDAQTEDTTASDTATTAANPLGSLFGGGTGGIGSLLGGLTGGGSSGTPAWVGWNGRTFGVHLGQRPATGTGSQSNLSSGLTGETGGMGNLLGGLTGGTGSTGNLLSGLTGGSGTGGLGGLLGGLTGGTGTGGIGNLLGGLMGGSGGTGGLGSLLGSLTGSASGLETSSATDRTSSNSGAVSSSNWQEIPAYGTELETLAEWQKTTSTDNTTDNNGDESSNDISTTEDTEQTTTVDPTTLRLPLVEVNGGSPNMYGGLTEGTPHLFDGLLEAIQNNNGNADFGDLPAGVNLNEIATRQFLGINDPHFTDTGDYIGFIPNGRGHIQVDEQNGLTAIYYIQPKLPSANKSLMAVSPGGSLTRVGSGLVYVYYDPKTGLYIHIDLYTGIMGRTGKLLGGLLGGGR